MQLEILCDPYLPAKEAEEVEKFAKQMKVTPEKFIRLAVASFASQCVPTHGARKRARKIV